MVVPDDLFGLIPLWVAVYVVGAIGFGTAGAAVYFRFARPVLLGQRQERRLDQPIRRFLGMLLVVLGQRRVLMSVSLRWRDLAGIGHAVIFWGFIFMVTGYVLFIFLDAAKPWLSGYILSPTGLKVFFWMLDILTVGILAAVFWAAFRRWVGRPDRLKTLRSADAAVVLIAIGVLMLLHLLSEGAHVAAVYEGEQIGREIKHLVDVPSSKISTTTPIAGNIGRGLYNAGLSFDAANLLHGLFYWFHYLLVLGLGVYIAFSKHTHLVASPLNAYFRSLKPRGALLPIANLEEAEVWGARRPQEFSWKSLLDGYACAVCGRCTDNCPANLSGKPLSPMHLVTGLKDNLLDVAPALAHTADDREAQERAADEKPFLGGPVTEEWAWNCVTCGACEQECPVMVEHIDTIVDVRRHLVMDEGRVPPTAERALLSLETRGHPWRGTQATRMDWAEGLPVKVLSASDEGPRPEVLFWVGCTSALEKRSQSVARAMARVLDRAGVSYAVLGMDESCNGDPARRIGHEYLFTTLAQRAIETLNERGVTTIVTACPHCFNVMKNEYADFGGVYHVEHYATFVKRLMDEGRLKMVKPIAARVTYHDSCYLGRYNGVYDEPRQILEAIPGVEVRDVPLRNRERGFCCGAGGGHMWLEDSAGTRLNHVRTGQVLDTEPDTIGVSCPFCLQMFEDGVKFVDRQDDVRVVDVIELVADSMDS